MEHPGSILGKAEFMLNIALFVYLFLPYTGSIFRGKFKYLSVLPYGPNTKIQHQNYINKTLNTTKNRKVFLVVLNVLCM